MAVEAEVAAAPGRDGAVSLTAHFSMGGVRKRESIDHRNVVRVAVTPTLHARGFVREEEIHVILVKLSEASASGVAVETLPVGQRAVYGS